MILKIPRASLFQKILSIWAAAKGDGGSFACISGGVTHEHHFVSPWEAACPPTSHCCPGTAGIKSTSSGTLAQGLPPPLTPVTEQDPAAWELSPNRVTTDLTPKPGPGHPCPLTPQPPKQSALAFRCCRYGGWVHARHTCLGEHAQCTGAPTCNLRLSSLSAPPNLPSLSVKSKKKGCHKYKRPCILMHTPWTQTSGGPETQWMYVYKTDKWILLHTGTVVTPREVYKTPPRFLPLWRQALRKDRFILIPEVGSSLHDLSGTWASILLAVCTVSKC